jgi:hypothetical protein
MQPDRSADPADSSLAGHRRGCAKQSIAAPTMNFCESILAKSISAAAETAGSQGLPTMTDDEPHKKHFVENFNKPYDTNRDAGRPAAVADAPTLHRFRFVLLRVPSSSRFRGAQNICAGRISIMSEIRQGTVALAYHCVALRSLIFRARGFHAANIQADADLHTLSSHHRDAVHDMRRADAARIDRTARPQLQFADLSLRSLRFRRELFEGDVDKRNATPDSASRSKL